jgi:hypothetical protein
MSQTNRRTFMLQVVAAGSAVAASQALAQAKLSESDAQASALGYKEDTTKVDKAKFPKHAADQKCSGCQLYTGKAGDAAGPCSLFPGKNVTANGWCSAWVKKA